MLLIGDDAQPVLPDEVAGLQMLADAGGVTRRQLESVVGVTVASRLLGRVGIIQVLPNGYTIRHTQPGNEAYFDGALQHAAVTVAGATVGVIGCGGIGVEVARHMVAAGVRRFVLVDFDTVQDGNFNRQYLYRKSHVGVQKTEALSEALRELGASEVTVRNARIDGLASLQALKLPVMDALINCADDPPDVAITVSRHASEIGSIFARASVGVNTCTWGPILTPSSGLIYEHPFAADGFPRGSLRPCRESFGPTNSFAAAALSRDLVHVMCGVAAPSLLAHVRFDFESLTTTVTKYDE